MDSTDLQLQVQIGETRRVFFMRQPNTYSELADAIKKEIPKAKFMDFSLLFENDEEEYVVLNNDALCLRVAITSAKTIPGTDIRCLKLRVFEGSSPSIKADVKKTDSDLGVRKVGQKRVALEASYGKPSISDVVLRDNAIVKGIARMSNESFAERDDFDENSDEENYDRVYEDEATTPLQRYIQITEKQINEKRELIAKLREKEQDVCRRIDRVKSHPSDGNICRNCHLRLGHTSRTCNMDKCISIVKCGEEKFHSGETNTRELRSQIKKYEMELTKLTAELENKKSAISKSTDTLSSKIECDLFQAKKEDYLINGQKNWSLLRKHVYAVQQYCKQNFGGRLPAKQHISGILTNALSDVSSSGNTYHRAKQSGGRKRENPFIPQLEKYGIQFPKRPDECPSSPRSKKDCLSSVRATAPEDKAQEIAQLEMGLRESLRNTHSNPSATALAGNLTHTPAIPLITNPVNFSKPFCRLVIRCQCLHQMPCEWAWICTRISLTCNLPCNSSLKGCCLCLIPTKQEGKQISPLKQAR